MSAVPSRKASESRMAWSSSMTWTTALSDGIADVLLGHGPQREAEDRPAGGVGLRVDMAAVGLDDGAGDRQTDPHALTPVGHARLEQLRHHRRRDPRAGVGDADGDHAVLAGSRRNDELAWLRVFHRLDRVAQQIEQDLLDLHLVGEHEIDRRVELKPHANALFL